MLSAIAPIGVSEGTDCRRPNRQPVQDTNKTRRGLPENVDSLASQATEGNSHQEDPWTVLSCAQFETRPKYASERSENGFDRDPTTAMCDNRLSPASFSPLSFGSVARSPNTDDTDDTGTPGSNADFTWLSAGVILDTTHPLLALESATIEDLIRSYHAWKRGENDQHANPSTCSLARDSGGGHEGKRKLEDDQQQQDEPREQGGPTIKKARKQVNQGEVRLACHFQKRHPERYPGCGIKERGFRDITQIKQHLRRAHRQRPYCPLCKAEFKTEDEKNEHIVQMITTPCQMIDAPLPDGLSEAVINGFRNRVDKKDDLNDQWFSLWDIFFPGVPRPLSSTFDLCGEIHVQALGLGSYLEVDGPRVVLSFLRSRNVSVGYDDQNLSPDVDGFIKRVLLEAFRQLFQDWCAQRTPPSTVRSGVDGASLEPAPPSRGCTEPETPYQDPTPLSGVHGMNPPTLFSSRGLLDVTWDNMGWENSMNGLDDPGWDVLFRGADDQADLQDCMPHDKAIETDDLLSQGDAGKA